MAYTYDSIPATWPDIMAISGVGETPQDRLIILLQSVSTASTLNDVLDPMRREYTVLETCVYANTENSTLDPTIIPAIIIRDGWQYVEYVIQHTLWDDVLNVWEQIGGFWGILDHRKASMCEVPVGYAHIQKVVMTNGTRYRVTYPGGRKLVFDAANDQDAMWWLRRCGIVGIR